MISRIKCAFLDDWPGARILSTVFPSGTLNETEKLRVADAATSWIGEVERTGNATCPP
jgi:hypothetical protein